MEAKKARLERRARISRWRRMTHRGSESEESSGSSDEPSTAIEVPRKSGSLCIIKFLVLVLLVSVISGGLIAVVISTQARVEQLRLEIEKVESGNQKVPNQLHEYHTKLKAVSENQTAIANRILEISDRINNLTTQLGMLRTSVSKLENGLMKSGTEDLLSLPDDVKTMQSTMATFGSQLRDVTSQLGMVRNASTSMVGRVDACANRVTAVEDLVKNVPDRTQVEAMNKSVAFALEDLHMHHGDIQALKNSTANLPILEASVKNLTESVNWVTESFASTSASVSALENRILQCCDQMAQNDTANG